MGLAREPLRFVNADQQLGVIEADRLIPVGFRDGWKEGEILLDSLSSLLRFRHLLEIDGRLLEFDGLQQSLVLFINLPADLRLVLAPVSTLASDCSIFCQNRLQ